MVASRLDCINVLAQHAVEGSFAHCGAVFDASGAQLMTYTALNLLEQFLLFHTLTRSLPPNSIVISAAQAAPLLDMFTHRRQPPQPSQPAHRASSRLRLRRFFAGKSRYHKVLSFPEASSWLFAPRTKRVAPALSPPLPPPFSFLPVLQIIVGKCGLQVSDYVASADNRVPACLSVRVRLMRTGCFVTRHVQGCILARCGGDCTLLLLSDDKVRHPPFACVMVFSRAYLRLPGSRSSLG